MKNILAQSTVSWLSVWLFLIACMVKVKSGDILYFCYAVFHANTKTNNELLRQNIVYVSKILSISLCFTWSIFSY